MRCSGDISKLFAVTNRSTRDGLRVRLGGWGGGTEAEAGWLGWSFGGIYEKARSVKTFFRFHASVAEYLIPEVILIASTESLNLQDLTLENFSP